MSNEFLLFIKRTGEIANLFFSFDSIPNTRKLICLACGCFSMSEQFTFRKTSTVRLIIYDVKVKEIIENLPYL